jgi:hypothetical protein
MYTWAIADHEDYRRNFLAGPTAFLEMVKILKEKGADVDDIE